MIVGSPHALAQASNSRETLSGRKGSLQSDEVAFRALPGYLDRLVPLCELLLDAAAEAGQVRPGS